MRRSSKPFTIEIKKRGGRKRDPGETSAERIEPLVFPSQDLVIGRDIRFRDAESLFRAGMQPAAAPEHPLHTESASEASGDPSHRRILPDLIAEAALSEAALAAMPEPRRRGRPPKVRTGDVLPHPPAKRGRKPAAPAASETFSFFDLPDPAPPVAVPAVLYLAASARRRAARATGNLPRAERWKRRLPKVCW